MDSALPFFYCICPTPPYGISLFFPGCYCLLRSSFWVGTTCKGLWSPGPQPERQVTSVQEQKQQWYHLHYNVANRVQGLDMYKAFGLEPPKWGAARVDRSLPACSRAFGEDLSQEQRPRSSAPVLISFNLVESQWRMPTLSR